MQRPAAAARAAAAAVGNEKAGGASESNDDDGAAHVHGFGIMIRLVIALLAVFAVFHLAMWKVVYDFAADADHGKLRRDGARAWSSLSTLFDHL